MTDKCYSQKDTSEGVTEHERGEKRGTSEIIAFGFFYISFLKRDIEGSNELVRFLMASSEGSSLSLSGLKPKP